ncbi:thioredoxin-disulfide reductase [Patescibacteria group bacterium]|nr:thioredoxin-disulfide reductase [Patescibacteria group bacterium]
MSSENEIRNVIIIGSGPAGLTAAIYASRAALNPLVLAGVSWGGQLMTTTDVENFPGFIDGIKGPQLMQNMLEQAQKFGTQIEFENVTSVDFSKEGEFKVFCDSKKYTAKSIIIAVGSKYNTLQVEGEKEFWGKGVSTCATCDGAFFKNKIVTVVGGGDSSCEEANFLTRFATKVYLIVRKDKMRASKIMQDRVKNNSKIEIIYNSNVEKIYGDTVLRGITILDTSTNTKKEIQTDGLFLAIGHSPNTEFLKNSGLELDEKCYIKVTNNTQTNISGVFVAGDVKDYRYKQAITASGMGCQAALDMQKYLEEKI